MASEQVTGRASGPAVCQVCGVPVDGTRPVVSCAECATPHHQDCWDYAGGCSTFACGGRDRAPSVGCTDVHEGGPHEVLKIDGEGRGRVGARPVALARLRQPRPFPAVAATGVTRLDLDTPLEQYLQYGAAVVFVGVWCVATPKHHPTDWSLVARYWPVASAMLMVRMGIDCTYVLDNEARVLLYSRSVFGLEQSWRVCDFSEIREVFVQSELHTHKGRKWHTYFVQLLLASGKRITVSDETRDSSQAGGLARRLAGHVGARLTGVPGGAGERVDEDANVPMVVEHSLWRSLPVIGRASLWWTLFFVFTVAMNFVARCR